MGTTSDLIFRFFSGSEFLVGLHFKAFLMSSFQHIFLQVFSDIEDEKSVILHCESNMLLPAVMQVTGNTCETLNFSGAWVQFYWTARKVKRELPSAQGYNGCNFHIKSTVSGKEKEKERNKNSN